MCLYNLTVVSPFLRAPMHCGSRMYCSYFFNEGEKNRSYIDGFFLISSGSGVSANASSRAASNAFRGEGVPRTEPLNFSGKLGDRKFGESNASFRARCNAQGLFASACNVFRNLPGNFIRSNSSLFRNTSSRVVASSSVERKGVPSEGLRVKDGDRVFDLKLATLRARCKRNSVAFARAAAPRRRDWMNIAALP